MSGHIYMSSFIWPCRSWTDTRFGISQFGFRNTQKELFLSLESAKDCGSFHDFIFYFLVLSFLHLFRKVALWTHRLFLHKSETTFSIQFSPNNIFMFSSQNSKMSRNMHKLRHKVRNGQNLRHGSPNFKHFQSGFSN